MSDVDTLELEAELYNRLKIDPMDLEREFINCAANIAYLGAQHGAALRDNLRAKIRVKKLWALLLIQAREDLEPTSPKLGPDGKFSKTSKGPTVGEVEAHASQMPAWGQAQEEDTESEVALAIAKTNLTAMLAKRDMLVQMGANVRAEMERDPTIRAHKEHQRRDAAGDW